jgi:plastocyanin domain-containing protein
MRFMLCDINTATTDEVIPEKVLWFNTIKSQSLKLDDRHQSISLTVVNGFSERHFLLVDDRESCGSE